MQTLVRRIRIAATRSLVEPLEARELLSAARHAAASAATTNFQFSQMPTAIQTGLNTLASNNGLGAPAASQHVLLGNSNGVETFSVNERGNGLLSRLTVDANGMPFSPPVTSATTFGAIPDAAAVTEFNAIASAMNVTVPSGTATVSVSTPSSGPAVFTMALPRGRGRGTTSFSVDATGMPVGNVALPLSVLPSAVQVGFANNTPAGATPLADTSRVTIGTQNGLTTFSSRFGNSTVTLDGSGALATLPSNTKAQFSTAPTAAQTQLQSLATAAGVTGTLGANQSMQVFDEGNGTMLFSLRLNGQSTVNGRTVRSPVNLTVDQFGTPTIVPGSTTTDFSSGFEF